MFLNYCGGKLHLKAVYTTCVHRIRAHTRNIYTRVHAPWITCSFPWLLVFVLPPHQASRNQLLSPQHPRDGLFKVSSPCRHSPWAVRWTGALLSGSGLYVFTLDFSRTYGGCFLHHGAIEVPLRVSTFIIKCLIHTNTPALPTAFTV